MLKMAATNGRTQGGCRRGHRAALRGSESVGATDGRSGKRGAVNLQDLLARWLAAPPRWLLALVAVPALVSLAAGAFNALTSPGDFQYPNACRFIAGEDPFTLHLDSPEAGSSAWRKLAPVYLHFFYFLLAPLCVLSWQQAASGWLIANLVFAVATVRLLTRRAGLGFASFVLITCLFALSTPLRNTLGIGQTSLFILFVFVLAGLATRREIRVGASVLSFIKYSFAGSWLGLMLRRDPPTIIASGAVATLLVALGAWWIADGNIVQALFAPMVVARESVAPGHGDLMTLFHYAFDPDNRYRLPVAVALLLANVAVVYRLTGLTTDPLLQLAIASTASLLFLNHLLYDSVFLLPALVVLLARLDLYTWIGGIAIGLHWYVLRVIDLFDLRSDDLPWTAAVAALYATVLACVVMRARAPGTSATVAAVP